MMQNGPPQKEKDEALFALVQHAGSPAEASTIEQIKKLIDDGANVNYQKMENGNCSPLHMACSAMGGDPKIVKLLVSKGADVNLKDAKDNTPLHMAAAHIESDNEFKEIYDYLIEQKADINVKNKDQKAPIELMPPDQTLSGTAQFGSKMKHKSTKVEMAQTLFVQTTATLPLPTVEQRRRERSLSDPIRPTLPLEGETRKRSTSVPTKFGAKEETEADEFEDLFETSPKAVLHAQKDSPSDTSVEEEETDNRIILDEKNYEVYQAAFTESDTEDKKVDPYVALAQLIKKRNISDSPAHGQTENFKKRLDSVIPAVEFAVRGARRERDESEEGSEERKAAEEKLKTFEQILGMFNSLKALANNKIRYTPEQYNAQVKKIFEPWNKKIEAAEEKIATLEDQHQKLYEQGIEDGEFDEANLGEKEREEFLKLDQELEKSKEEYRNLRAQRGELKDAVDNIAREQIFKGRKHKLKDKGSTPFQTGKDSKETNQKWEVDPKKLVRRVKIDHEDGGKKVTVQFSYNRAKLLGTRPFGGHLKLGSSGAELKELRAQAADAVSVAINEFNKGSKDNPINIQYTNPRFPQPEAALAVLMEFKKRAIEEGKPFYAKDNQGNLVKISPNSNFLPTDLNVKLEKDKNGQLVGPEKLLSPKEQEKLAKIGIDLSTSEGIKAFEELQKETNLFNTYAQDTPALRGRKGIKKSADENAGYKLFKNVTDDKGNSVISKSGYKKAEDKGPFILKAMEQQLKNETKAAKKEVNAKMDDVAQTLGGKPKQKLDETETAKTKVKTKTK